MFGITRPNATIWNSVNNMGMIKSIALAAGISAVAALGAQAATVTVSAPVYDTTDPTALPAGASWTKPAHITAGSISKVTKSVFGDDTTEYYFVEGVTRDPAFPANSPAVLAFAKTMTALSLLWGSPDSYNYLEFWLDGAKVATVNGKKDVNGGTPTNNGPDASVKVSSLTFDTVKFYSKGDNAFEFANVAAQVPVPAAGLMLVSAVGGLAALRRRKA